MIARPLRAALSARMPIILIAVVLGATALTGGRFAQTDNLVNVLGQVSFQGTIAFGMTAIIITGGIDLSVGSLVALTGVVAAVVMQAAGAAGLGPIPSIGLGALAAMGTGAAAGALSGAVVAWLAIPPFIVTLAAMLMARGGAFIISDGQPVYDLPAPLRELGRGFIFEGWLGRVAPVPVVMMLGTYAVFATLLSRTVLGREIVAVGSNEQAARLAGVPVRRAKLLVYLLTGLLTGLVGVVHDGKLMVGDPKVGEMWELHVIAAVVVGGTSLFGGRGTMTGTLIGVLIIGVLNNSMNLRQVEHFWQNVVLGGVILAAALADAGLRRLHGANR